MQVYWDVKENKLVPQLVYDKPLIVKGNEMARRLLKYLKVCDIETTEDINESNTDTDRII